MAQLQPQGQTRPTPKPTFLPYEVRVDGARRGAFRDVRDAIASARIKKRELPSAMVGVADASTGQFLFEVRD